MSKTEPFTLVFPNIPKTGGTTLLYHFRTNLGDEKVFVYGPYSRADRFFSDLPQLEEMRRRDVAAFQVVQGHGVSEDLISILRDANIRLLVVLRHPVAYVRSYFNHCRNDSARLGKELDSAQFLSSTNRISTVLLNKFPSFIDQAAVTPYDQVVSILRKFDYVFTAEMMDLQVTGLMREMNLPAVMERRRVAGEYARLDVSDEELIRNNALDLEIFKTASKATSSGPQHNPFGFDHEGKDAAIQHAIQNTSSAEDATRSAYTQLARRLCIELKAEGVLAKIARLPVALDNTALFGEILRAEWAQYQEGLNSVQREISHRHYEGMCVRLNKRKQRSTSMSDLRLHIHEFLSPVPHRYYQMKTLIRKIKNKLIKKIKNKPVRKDDCPSSDKKSQLAVGKEEIRGYLGQEKVVLKKDESHFHFPRNPEYSWERFPVFKNALFPVLKDFAWLDGDHVDENFIRANKTADMSEKDVEVCRQFSEQGYVIIENLFPEELLDSNWHQLEREVEAGNVWNTRGEILDADDEFGLYAKGRILNIHKLIPKLNECFRYEKLIRILEMLLGKEVVPYQTINSFCGSEQPAHSDAVHMTTFPLGFMIAAWVAFEDIDEDCGLLGFYPGSHKLDYKMSDSLSEELKFDNHKYEQFMKEVIDKNDLQPACFAPCKKGDVLIWHHNLIHGGSEIRDKKKTRKSLVSHYFVKDVIAYCEVTGRKCGNYDPYATVAKTDRNSKAA